MTGINVSGIDEFIISLDNADISEATEKAILKKAIEPAKQALERDTPKKSGKLAKIKIKMGKNGIASTAILLAGAYWGMFEEFGTSKSKKNIGFFDRSVKSTEGEVVDIISKELFEKLK